MEATMIGAYAGMVIVLAAFSAETRGIVSSRSLTYLILIDWRSPVDRQGLCDWRMAFCHPGWNMGCLRNILNSQTS